MLYQFLATLRRLLQVTPLFASTLPKGGLGYPNNHLSHHLNFSKPMRVLSSFYPLFQAWRILFNVVMKFLSTLLNYLLLLLQQLFLLATLTKH